MLKQQIGPLLRGTGFKSAASTWRLQSARGDVALINLQTSRWNADDEIRFYVNLAIVPAAWWEFLSQQLDKPPSTPRESHGLLRRRLDPPKAHPPLRHGWLVHDAHSARTCGQVLNEQ